jgi:hypothetical protein
MLRTKAQNMVNSSDSSSKTLVVFEKVRVGK